MTTTSTSSSDEITVEYSNDETAYQSSQCDSVEAVPNGKFLTHETTSTEYSSSSFTSTTSSSSSSSSPSYSSSPPSSSSSSILSTSLVSSPMHGKKEILKKRKLLTKVQRNGIKKQGVKRKVILQEPRRGKMQASFGRHRPKYQQRLQQRIRIEQRRRLQEELEGSSSSSLETPSGPNPSLESDTENGTVDCGSSTLSSTPEEKETRPDCSIVVENELRSELTSIVHQETIVVGEWSLSRFLAVIYSSHFSSSTVTSIHESVTATNTGWEQAPLQEVINVPPGNTSESLSVSAEVPLENAGEEPSNTE